MSATDTKTAPGTNALTAMNELLQMQAKAMAEIFELNLATTRSVMETTAAMQAPDLSARATGEWQRLMVEHSRRISEICSRSTAAWTSSCANQTRQWSEAAEHLVRSSTALRAK
jgi:hypothetical protein